MITMGTRWRNSIRYAVRKIGLIIEYWVKGGAKDMIDIYVALVRAHRRTCIPEKATRRIKLVPEDLREDVVADLLAIGFDGNGDPIKDEE